MIEKLTLQDGNYIAYKQFIPEQKNNKIGIIFHGGFKSDMEGSKAVFIEAYCKKNQIPFLRFDYLGHGQSSGEFTDFTIGEWAQNSIEVLDKLTSGKQILIGSSMGGWLVLLSALKRPQRIHSLFTIAAAPDFTQDLMWDKFKESEKQILQTEGIYTLPADNCNVNPEDYEPYTITMKLIEEARNHLLLNDDIAINCPVTLLHGMQDLDVPYEFSLKINSLIQSKDVKIILQKNGDHRMSSPESLKLIEQTINNLYY